MADDPAAAELAKAVSEALAAGEESWKRLARRFPGKVPFTPVGQIDFLASEYHWSLEQIAGLDSRQTFEFVKAALERRAKAGKPAPTGRREGWDRKTEARNKWIYEKCCKWDSTYDEIVAELNVIASQRGWAAFGSKQRIQQIAKVYAKRQRRPDPPSRRNL